MGNFTSTFRASSEPPKPIRLLMLGLDFSGKTTVLYKLKSGHEDVVTTIPTIGFNVETLNLRGTIFTAWDIGGRSRIRPLSKHYYKETDAIIFVIDSNDPYRINQARHQLDFAIQDKELSEKPLLVLCNKQDLPNALSPTEISKRFGLAEKYSDRKWNAVGCTATKGKGLYEGLEWLSKVLEVEAMKDSKDVSEDDTDNITLSSEISASSDDTPIKIGFDPTEAGKNLTLEHFGAIKQGTECPFAKAATLWGGCPSPEAGSTLEDQAKSNVKALAEFVRRSNAGDKLDGFCIELNDPKAAKEGPKELGKCVRRMLTALSDNDPAGETMMKVNYVGSRGWRFRFNKADFFVTTFAPCYPPTSSRYAFGAGRAFVLLQPEASFARHDLPSDTADTNWEAPKTIRDKTRVAFRKAGRGYYIPNTTRYPPAEHIVKPLRDDGVSVVPWWKPAREG